MSGVCVHRFHARAAQTGAPRASPVYGAPGLHLHPVQGKVDLPHEGGHPLHHRVRHAQDHGRLPPHDAVGTPESAPAPRGPRPVPLAPPLRSRPQPPNFTFRRHPLSRRHGHHQGPGRTVPGQLSTASWPGSPAASGCGRAWALPPRRPVVHRPRIRPQAWQRVKPRPPPCVTRTRAGGETGQEG